MSKKNPWLGLASYQEPQNTDNDYLFCGRDDETVDLVRFVDNNLFVTLYGSSGVGKTSLLRAGVMPNLRRRGYFPLYVRLSQQPADIPFAEAITRMLCSCRLSLQRLDSIVLPDPSDRLYLWYYFATTRFTLDGCEVYPVVILDQFEEVFRDDNKDKADLLLRQIYLLLNNELDIPDKEGFSADTNYRFVASIREDFLFVLEDSIDELSLDLYKSNRYRLRPMKPEQARQVVLMPGKDCIEQAHKNVIADKIVSLAKRNKQAEVDTLLLSLVCSGTYDRASNHLISISDLSVWKNNPMELYYHDAVKSLSASQVRFIQYKLIRDDGSRRRLDVAEVKTVFSDAAYQHITQGDNRLFAVDQGQVELLHDQLGMAVFNDRKAFEERERKRKLRQSVLFFGIIAAFVIGLFAFQNYRVKQQRWKMLENQTRFVTEKALQLIDNHNPLLAQRLLIQVLPQNVSKPKDRPYVQDAEFALRRALSYNVVHFHDSGSTEPDFEYFIPGDAYFFYEDTLLAAEVMDEPFDTLLAQARERLKYCPLTIGECAMYYLDFDDKYQNETTTSPRVEDTGSVSIFGHAYVDLGLSVKWATCNVGATQPEGYGEYFAWGETETKTIYTGKNSKTYGKSLSDIGGDSRYDVARARWGGSWRMPTVSELEELKNKCRWEWTNVNGVKGSKVTGPNGNSIFLPAAGYRGGSYLRNVGLSGYYWSSTPDEDYDSRAYYLDFSGEGQGVNWDSRYYGQSVRPVSE